MNKKENNGMGDRPVAHPVDGDRLQRNGRKRSDRG